MKRRDDGIDVQGKAPGFWFYPQDFERDMQILSLDAQGLWSRMLCWMHFNIRNRGYLELPTGEPMNNQDIAAKCGKPVELIELLVSEMKRHGVYSLDERGCIFNRRMVKDTDITKKRAEAAKNRALNAERTDHGTFAPAKHPAKNDGVGNLLDGVVDAHRLQANQQNTVPSDSSSDSSKEKNTTGGQTSDTKTEQTVSPVTAKRKRSEFPDAERERWFTEMFWPFVWLKVGRGAALKAWMATVYTVEMRDRLIAEAKRQGPTILARARKSGSTPLHVSTWINKERYDDEDFGDRCGLFAVDPVQQIPLVPPSPRYIPKGPPQEKASA